ncbi:putative vesicular-fusion protein sec17-like protein [Smittium mucronatum]|uniref:Putative vesicular-fusion protein sec17-like protein n=1 Tax=Smittium mucronatum TaxID=133383 RepID=A0A1R0GUG6_9FUNG|nr:putative vesicular-fusion protein sec17-like protein [Smittium mucronatum]
MAEAEARDLLQKANKKAEQKGWFGSRKYDEAAELFERAANQFKIAKLWSDAGDSFMRAAEMYTKDGEIDDSSQAFISASKCYKKVKPESSITALQKAVSILIQKGRFHAAAGHQKDIANTYETELLDFEKAMTAYETAAECIDNQLTKWSIKDYFFKAGLCYLAGNDQIGASKAVERYQELDPSFSSTRECKLLINLINDISEEDVESFTNHVAEFDQLTQLDSWKTALLLKTKKSIADNENDLT